MIISPITPQQSGAVYDGKTDDTAALQRTLNNAAFTGATVYFPPGPGLLVSQTIRIPLNVSLVMDAPLIYNGPNSQPCLIIGSETDSVWLMSYKINVKSTQLSDWLQEANIGVQMINLISCSIHIVQADGFTIGVQAAAVSKGFSYNQLELGQIMNNKIGLDLSASKSGWVNENLYTNGRFGSWSNVNPSMSRYGVRILSPDQSYLYNNNNTFYKPCFELGQSLLSGNAEAIPILIYHGEQNAFYDCRNEDNHKIFARLLNESSNHIFTTGYGECSYENIDDQSQYPVSTVASRAELFSSLSGHLIFNSGAMHKKACYYNGNTLVNVPTVSMMSSTQIAAKKSANIKLNHDYLELSSAALGIFVNTTESSRFVLKKDVESGFGGRAIIVCFNKSGAVLDSSINGVSTVKGTSNASPYFSSSVYGGGGVGGYITGSDTETDYYFWIHPSVAYIHVMVTGGSNPLRIRSFCLYAFDTSATVWTGYEEIIPGVNLGIAPPTTGTWEKGRIIMNDNIVPLGSSSSRYIVEGWQCIASPNQWIEKQINTN
ncbi:glycosyl hydrolase family 28-related protein [Paenibacillus terrigena]|uniref:glycosyl hydrolase family 28-related protein n=1 Tax=Paenibacillus terrigena TaxID=369333 RepID=UPI0028D6EE3B|nr:glycosyl hydrolase family 28-related protein [Paenibacillus terrigena]